MIFTGNIHTDRATSVSIEEGGNFRWMNIGNIGVFGDDEFFIRMRDVLLKRFPLEYSTETDRGGNEFAEIDESLDDEIPY